MYHNIYKIRNGKYQIIKGNQYYGAFDKLEDALFERDALESVAWDIDKLCELPHKVICNFLFDLSVIIINSLDVK